MHYLMLVTLAMPNGATSLDARKQAMERLLADDSFCGEGGRFGSPLCDWFVIGGRWSGRLQKALLGDAYQTAFGQEFPDMASGWFSSSLVDKHHDQLNQLWQRFGGTGKHPYNRDGYDHLGCEDDAMPVNQALYDLFLAKDPGKSCETFADLDDEPVDETFIGRKWLVVVDYHN
jgi:hypothetical protein